jgi:hypothetical protein
MPPEDTLPLYFSMAYLQQYKVGDLANCWGGDDTSATIRILDSDPKMFCDKRS